MSTFAPQRYDRVAALLHWIIGIALLGQVSFGWLLGQFARGTPEKALAVNLHKSSGLLLALLILARVLWRLRHRPPAYPASVTLVQIRAIRAGHALLYFCMIGMPLSGYLASNFSRHGINLFNRFPIAPWGPDDKTIYGLLNGAHDALGFVFSLLILGHIALALHHTWIARDGLSTRISLAPAAPPS
jgi:cytochrome b561